MGNLQGVQPRKVELPMIRLIKGHNPRGYALGEAAFAGEAFEELVDSLRSYGDVLVPILLRPIPGMSGMFELVSGERRFRAAKEAGLHEISCEVRDLNDEEIFEAALAENQIREDVAKIDRILATLHALSTRCDVPTGELRTWFFRLIKKAKDNVAIEPGSIEERLTVQMKRLSMPSLPTLVASWAPYLDLTAEERQGLRRGLPEAAALALLKLKDRPERAALLEQALEHSWTAAQMQRAVQAVLEENAPDDLAQQLRETQEVARQFRGLLKTSELAKYKPEELSQLTRDLQILMDRYRRASAGDGQA